MGDESYYTLLGLGHDASAAQIRRAYRRIARTCHPDLHPDDPQADGRFKQVSHAAAVLGDPERRAAYDRMAQLAQHTPAPPSITRWEQSGYEATEYLQLTPAEAAAGLAAPLTFYDAGGQPYTLTIHVPPGARHGQRLRLAGAGGPARRGAGRGDLVVILNISEPVSPAPPAPVSSRAPRALLAGAGVALAALLAIALTGVALTMVALLLFAP